MPEASQNAVISTPSTRGGEISRNRETSPIVEVTVESIVRSTLESPFIILFALISVYC